jgi:hypothetical protein
LYLKLKMFMTFQSDYMRIYGQRDVLLRTKVNNKLQTEDEYVNRYSQCTSIHSMFSIIVLEHKKSTLDQWREF